MTQTIAANLIIGLCYLCLAVVLFAPSIYVGWFYIIGRRVPGRSERLLRTLLLTFAVNLMFVYVATHVAFDYFLAAKDAENNAIALEAVRNAMESQKTHYKKHGRYYAVGPVRGPYRDEYGLRVKENVVLRVEPTWDNKRKTDTYQADAVHVWGTEVHTRRADGSLAHMPQDSPEASRLRAKLIRSVQ